MRYVVGNTGVIHLGKQGDHLARELLFTEPAAWERELGPGTAQLVFQPPGGRGPCPVPLERTGEGWLWRVCAEDTARAGRGQCELRYTAASASARSRTYDVYVAASLGACSDGQQGLWQRYLEQVLQAGAQAAEAAELAGAIVGQLEELTNLELLEIWNGGNEYVEKVSR